MSTSEQTVRLDSERVVTVLAIGAVLMATVVDRPMCVQTTHAEEAESERDTPEAVRDMVLIPAGEFRDGDQRG